MRLLSAAVIFGLFTVAVAQADAPKGGGKAKPAGDDSIDSILHSGDDKAAQDDRPKDDGKAKLPEKGPAKPPEKVDDKTQKASNLKPAKPDEPPPPPTDDNDNTSEAIRPRALEAVRPSAAPRRPGPYELGELDCRMLDGAGIERILPKKITAGEEPDLLCRVLVTQPATVATAAHTLTLSVVVGDHATYQQVRSVRVSSIGRRAIVFVVPADRISSEDAARVTMRAQLSGPAKPPTRELKFVVEPAD